MRQLSVPLEDATDAALTEVARRERTTREELVGRLIRARIHASEDGGSGPNAAVTESEVEPARLTKRRIARASIDGRLELKAHLGQLQATIRDHTTGTVVRCLLDKDTAGPVISLIGKRVVAEGLVRYGEDGTATSIEDVTAIVERAVGRPLEDFVSATPNLTDRLTPEEFLARVYGEE